MPKLQFGSGSAFYNVFCKRLMTRYKDTEILVLSYVAASLASAPVLFYSEPHCLQQLGNIDPPSWAAFLYLVLLMYGASMLLFFFVLERCSVTVASTSLYLVPVFGVTFAAFLLHERLSSQRCFGIAIIVASMILVLWFDSSASETATTERESVLQIESHASAFTVQS